MRRARPSFRLTFADVNQSRAYVRFDAAQSLLLEFVGNTAFDVGTIVVGWAAGEMLVPKRP